MNDIYSIPEFYDLYHHWKTNDIEFILKWAKIAGDPILELAAGTGRLAVPLIQAGYNYTGLDTSKDFVNWAQQKIHKLDDHSKIAVGDMRKFSLNQRFNFIFIGFNSILHLLNEADIVRCFECVNAHLTENGKFLIDVFVPQPEFLYRDPNQLYTVGSYINAVEKQVIVKEKNKFDSDTEINHISWYLYEDGSLEPEVYDFDMHILYPDTLDRLLTDAGFKIEQKFGDHAENKFNPDSDLQIYVSCK